ncbi:hypothetical protein Vi05172_g10340 [Venturia inaequalis]|nr:hypothetical protein Vi05172_g10340 [Venturia inaequalis]
MELSVQEQCHSNSWQEYYWKGQLETDPELGDFHKKKISGV